MDVLARPARTVSRRRARGRRRSRARGRIGRAPRRAHRRRAARPPRRALPLAVVAEAPRLHERRQPRSSSSVPKRAVGMPSDRNSSFSCSRSCPRSSAATPGHRADARGRLDRHVLELVRDDGRTVRQARERIRIAVLADDELAHGARAGVGRRVEEPERRTRAAARRARACARAARRRCTRRASRVGGSRLTRRGPGCRERPASARRGTPAAARATAGSPTARIDAARSAALTAPAPADRERPDRDPGRHLGDREQRVDAGERLRLDGHAEHGQCRLRGRHARQVGRAARPRDQHAEPALLRRAAYSKSRSGVR